MLRRADATKDYRFTGVGFYRAVEILKGHDLFICHSVVLSANEKLSRNREAALGLSGLLGHYSMFSQGRDDQKQLQ